MIQKFAAYVRTHLMDVFSGLQGAALLPPGARRILFRMAGYRLGRNVRVMQGVYVGCRNITFGSDVLVGARCHLGGGGRLTICDDVTLSPNVTLTTSTHRFGNSNHRCGDHTSADVTLERGCWIGVGATVLPGVTVGAGAVVAAGAVVTRSLPPDALYAGTPARKLRDLD